MWNWNRFVPMVIVGTAASIAPLLPAIALEPEQIATQAAKFVVRIDGAGGGTGFIVRKNGDRYTVLTNEHVIRSAANYTISTSDGRRYQIDSSQIRKFPGVDLAEVEFTSSNNYNIAELSNSSNSLSGGKKVYTYGFNAISQGLPERTSQFLQGTIAGNLPRGRNGYSLTFNLTVIPGLSGSPLIDENGKVVGIYGLADRQDGIFTLTLGIPIDTYKRFAAPTSPSIASTPAPTNLSSTRPTRLPSNRLFPSLPQLNGKATVIMKIANRGTITIEVDGDNAPITAGNFVDLVQKGFYNGLTFHRVQRLPQPFVAQGGDPSGNGTGGYIPAGASSERRIPLEILPDGAAEAVYSQTITDVPQLQHTRGSIAMARSNSPDSASSQFYFTLDKISFLDGNYAVFGQITQGLEVMDALQQGDKIISARVTQGLGTLQLP